MNSKQPLLKTFRDGASPTTTDSREPQEPRVFCAWERPFSGALGVSPVSCGIGLAGLTNAPLSGVFVFRVGIVAAVPTR